LTILIYLLSLRLNSSSSSFSVFETNIDREG
jgi:hypothetical protein